MTHTHTHTERTASLIPMLQFVSSALQRAALFNARLTEIRAAEITASLALSRNAGVCGFRFHQWVPF